MKQLLLLFCFFNAFSTAKAQCYQLVWADEFDGTSLNPSKWTPVVGEGGAVSGNAELQYYTSRPENIEVSSGTLKIIARAESYGGNAYTSARMQTKNLGDWLYGKFEARIKLPVAQGMWPAFWLLPTDNAYGIWPRSGEMDIMELIGREPSHAYSTIHTSNDGTVHSYGDRYDLSSGTFADAFHVFSMEWSPNSIKFYVDGILFSTKTNTTVSPYPWVFDKRFYMLLNLAIGGPWAGAPDGTTTFPQTMEVDYVRVYQQIQDIAVTGRTLVEPNTSAVFYSVPPMAGVTYQWSVSGDGNSIPLGQGTSTAMVNWGSTNGLVSVLMNDGCTPTATASTPVTVSPNLWRNYGFEENFMAWDTRPAYSSNVSFSISTSDFTEGVKAACVQTNVAGANAWDYQLSRTNLDLVAGTSYTLRFNAKANANRTIPIAFIRTTDFGVIAYQTINLTTSWQTFTLTFTPSSNVNVMFNADLATQVGTNCFDDFTFGRTALLPLELLHFNSKIEQQGNRLSWQFADTKDLENVVIQKSQNGYDYTPLSIFRVSDTGFRNDGSMSALDDRPFELTYYRLKMKEIDDNTHFSKVISVKRLNFKQSIRIYPNPASDSLTIENAEGKDIFILNAFGQVVLTFQRFETLGRLDVSRLANGLYFVRVGQEVVRFVKN